jgi:hypothetical protein
MKFGAANEQTRRTSGVRKLALPTTDHEHVHDHVNVHVDVHVIVDVVGFFLRR